MATNKAPLTLELVPLDPPAEKKPEPGLGAPGDALPAQGTPSEPTLDHIEIKPLERPVPVTSGKGPKPDPYAAKAASEYAEGHIDGPLWERAMAQANGDKAAAAAIYVRSRATALRLFDRDPSPRAPTPSDRLPKVREVDDKPGVFARYRLPIIGAALAVPIAVGGLVYTLTRSSPPPEVKVAAAAPGARPGSVPAKAAPANSKAQPSEPAGKAAAPDLSRKVQELRDAGNFNVMVLYAVEWTRKEPENAAAWDALRSGYVRLRQFDDAVQAANKAVELAPDDPKLWRSLAEASLDRDDPATALSAYEQAVARDADDVASLYQVGLLSARLGQPQAARAAFDRALTVKPGDAIAQCLKAAVAQMPPARDAYTMAVQIRQIDNRCHGREAVTAAK